MKYIVIITCSLLLLILNVNVCLFVIQNNIPRRAKIAFTNINYNFISDKTVYLASNQQTPFEKKDLKPLKSTNINLHNTKITNKPPIKIENKIVNLKNQNITTSTSNTKADPFNNKSFKNTTSDVFEPNTNQGYDTIPPLDDYYKELIADYSIKDPNTLRQVEIAWGQWHANIGNFLTFDYVAKNPNYNDNGKAYIKFIVTRDGKIKDLMVKSDTPQGTEIIKKGIYLMAGHRILDFPHQSLLKEKTFKAIIKACSLQSMSSDCNRRHTALDHPDFEKYFKG